MKLKFKNIVAINAVALSVLFTSSFAIADAYQIDLRANAVRVDNDGYSNKEKIFSATGAYYFNAVNTVNVPLAEAAFLGKSSNVNANAQRFSLDDFNVGDYSASNYRVGAAFFIPENFFLYPKNL